MSSIIRSSSSSRRSGSATSLDEIPSADPLSASKGHRTRSGRRFGTSIVNTPSKSAKKNKEGGGGGGATVGALTTTRKSTAKKNRSAGRFLSRASSTKKRSSSQQQLSTSLPAADLSYDFASLSLAQTFGSVTNLRSTSVGASSSSESRDDYEDAVAMRRLPSAITADYSVKMSGTAASISSSAGSSSGNFVNAASIFRSKKNTNRAGIEMASTVPYIQRSNPIFDTDRHYTINFESDDDEGDDSEEREGVATTTKLGTASRLEVDASGNYVIRHVEQQKREETEGGASSIDSIFRMVDKVLDNTDAAMSWMCLQRANPVIDSDDEDAIQHHDLHLKEETNYYQPERMWSKREGTISEEDGVVLEMGNQLAEDEVNGYTIPLPK